MSEQKTLTTDERRAILDREVQRYVKQGFRVVSRTDMTAQLVKPKSFGCLWVILALFTLGLALIVYIAKKDETVYLEVTPAGRVKRTK